MAESSESIATSGSSEPGPSASSTVAQCSAHSTRGRRSGPRRPHRSAARPSAAGRARSARHRGGNRGRPSAGFKANIGDALAERHPKRFLRFLPRLSSRDLTRIGREPRHACPGHLDRQSPHRVVGKPIFAGTVPAVRNRSSRRPPDQSAPNPTSGDTTDHSLRPLPRVPKRGPRNARASACRRRQLTRRPRTRATRQTARTGRPITGSSPTASNHHLPPLKPHEFVRSAKPRARGITAKPMHA